MAAKSIYLRRSARIGTPRLVKGRQFRLSQQRGGNQMNIAAYNMARASYEATCDTLAHHTANCKVCRSRWSSSSIPTDGCEIGRACYDEALRSLTRLDQATRDALGSYCEDCD